MSPANRLAARPAFPSLFVLLASAALLAGPALARPRIVVEFTGGSGGTVGTEGDSWVPSSTNCVSSSTLPASCGVTFTNNSSGAAKLGFSVKIGAVTYDSLFINKNGFVTFGTALTGNFAAAATLAQLQQVITANGTVTRPFIAPFYANLTISSVAATDFAPFGGGTSYFRASGDPLPPFVDAERVPAFAVTWLDGDFNNNPVINTQLVLYSAGVNGDFYLRLRYGQADEDQFTGLAGFSLVTGLSGDTFQLASTLGGATANLNDYFFVFRNGHLVPSLDPDGDLILDGVDNCRLVANANQLDSNGDGYGNICDGDLNNSGLVTAADLGILRSLLGQTAGSSATAAAADLNGSGQVTTADYAILRAALGTAPGPSGFKP